MQIGESPVLAYSEIVKCIMKTLIHGWKIKAVGHIYCLTAFIFNGCGKRMEQPIDKVDPAVYYNVKELPQPCHNI